MYQGFRNLHCFAKLSIILEGFLITVLAAILETEHGVGVSL